LCLGVFVLKFGRGRVTALRLAVPTIACKIVAAFYQAQPGDADHRRSEHVRVRVPANTKAQRHQDALT